MEPNTKGGGVDGERNMPVLRYADGQEKHEAVRVVVGVWHVQVLGWH